VKFSDWYDDATRRRYGTWGPPARHYPAPAGLSQKNGDWMRQRVIAVAMRYIGIDYQHHHIPAFAPPSDWPKYEPSPKEHRTGLDCSNFSAFVYNQALGIKPTGDVQDQAALTEVEGPGAGRHIPVKRIEKPEALADCARVLQTGDLVFINSTTKPEVSHVVIWIGSLGRAPDDAPLIIDSTGTDIKDSNGVTIPDGVHIRPVRASSWYFRSMSHALRIIPDGEKK
jgi:cell wall-associated NlpC family hydrolase